LFSSNYPISLPDSDIFPSQVLPVDVDADGKSELVVAVQGTNYDFSLKMFRADGTPTNWLAQTFPGDCIRLAAGDLDGDGRPSIIMVQGDSDDEDWLYTFTADGVLRPGWPVRVASDSRIYPLVVDLDRDGRNEVVTASSSNDGGGGNIRVLRGDGSPFPGVWPVSGSGLGPPVVADVDGDGFPEILATAGIPVGTNGGVSCRRHAGALVASAGCRGKQAVHW
jgi:hypothetical protein